VEHLKKNLIKPAHKNSVQPHRQQVLVSCKKKSVTLFYGKNPSVLRDLGEIHKYINTKCRKASWCHNSWYI